MYYQVGDSQELGRFRIGKMFKRLVHVTPTSFQPKKIMGAMASLTSAIVTGGLGPIIAPKVFSANSKTMQTLGLGMTAIGAAAGAVVLGPAIAAKLGPTLSNAGSLLGKGADFFGSPMSLFNRFFGGKTQAEQQQIAETITAPQIAGIEQGTINPNTLYPSQVAAPMLPAPIMTDTQAYGDGQKAPALVEAGMFGMSPSTVAYLALIGVGLVLFKQPQLRGRR